MTSRYRIEYALKSHKRDELIEWIKGLLAVPFVLHGDIDEYEKCMFGHDSDERKMETYEKRIEKTLQTRYLEVFHDVEKLIDNTIALDECLLDLDHPARTRLRQLVPSVGRFFTKLPLKDAFLIEDHKRLISRRTLVSPSFNDIRSILNTAQVLALTGTQDQDAKLRLITFDGDVTLYEDGKCLEKDSPLVALLVKLLSLDLYVAVVTAAGYPGQQGAEMYQERLLGLMQALGETKKLLPNQKNNFLVMGAESNYLFRYSESHGSLRFIEGHEWYLPVMKSWNHEKIVEIMDLSHEHLKHLRRKLRLEDECKTTIIRKERSLGIIPVNGYKIARETLEEMVLSILVELNDILNHNGTTVKTGANSALESSAKTEKKVQVCAFNGGSDVWVDIGDKALGVEALQLYLYKTCQGTHCEISKSASLHIGDQFASVGANDFKARLSACTVWIASPRETTEILQDLTSLLEHNSGKVDRIDLLS